MTRYNRQGKFNVPFGRYPRLSTEGIDEAHRDLLRHTDILCLDFEKTLTLARPGDFVFLDPPYDCPFNDYGNGQRWTEEDQRRLAEAFFKLPCKAVMVIAETPLTRALYEGRIAEIYQKQYAVNIRNRFKATAAHMVVTLNR